MPAADESPLDKISSLKLYDLSPLELELLPILITNGKPMTLEELVNKVDRDVNTVFWCMQKLVGLGICIRDIKDIKEKKTLHIKETKTLHIKEDIAIEDQRNSDILPTANIEDSIEESMSINNKDDVKSTDNTQHQVRRTEMRTLIYFAAELDLFCRANNINFPELQDALNTKRVSNILESVLRDWHYT
jgi:DNA-binding transcriptional regulator GbsR (MarR family)